MGSIKVDSGGAILAVNDFAESLRFYTEVLGFQVQARFDDPPFAILSHGPVSLSIAEQGHPADDLAGYVMTAPTEPSAPPVVIVLRVADMLAVYQELQSRGAEFASEPWSPPWGGGRFFVRDPSGFLIEIETLPSP